MSLELLRQVVLIGLLSVVGILALALGAQVAGWVFVFLLWGIDAVIGLFRHTAFNIRENYWGLLETWAERGAHSEFLGEVEPVTAKKRPHKSQLRRSQEAATGVNAIRLTSDRMGSCYFAKCLKAGVQGIPHMRSLESDPDCSARRALAADTASRTYALLNTGTLVRDPVMQKNAVLVDTALSICGENCHILECSRDSLPPICIPAKLLGHPPLEFHGLNEDEP